MDLPRLAAHATNGISVAPGFLPYLAVVGRPLAIAVTVYYPAEAAIFLLAGTVAIFMKDEQRGKRCVEIVQIVCRGWPWPPRLPGSKQ